MLLVNARAGASSIHGVGLIAREFIPSGTRLWEFREGFDVSLTREEFSALSPAAQEQTLHYGWFEAELDRLMLSGDDDRFTNHSDTPNTRWDGRFTVASVDIHPGEEITFDYNHLGGTDHIGWGRLNGESSVIAADRARGKD